MSSNTFPVTFHGEVIQGWDPDEVKANMAILFRLNPNNQQHAQKLKLLFSGRPMVIKKGISESTAQTYVDAISKAGGEVRIKAENEIPTDVDERRFTLRRKQGDRRASRRTSAILPDRRHNKGRRDNDPND